MGLKGTESRGNCLEEEAIRGQRGSQKDEGATETAKEYMKGQSRGKGAVEEAKGAKGQPKGQSNK